MASEIGLSQTVIGLSGSAYFVGFISGALVTPHIIAKVGHIRSFTPDGGLPVLLPGTPMTGWVWIFARFLLGRDVRRLHSRRGGYQIRQTHAPRSRSWDLHIGCWVRWPGQGI